MSGFGPNSDAAAWLRTSKRRPQTNQDNAPALQRGDEFGNAIMSLLSGKAHLAAREGSYFTAGNPVPGTGLATIAALAALVDTSPFAILTNLAPPGGPSVDLEYLKLTCTAPGTAGVSLNWAIKTDQVINRYSSGGSLLASPVPFMASAGAVNPSPGAAPNGTGAIAQSQLQLWAGALVALAAAQPRLFGHGQFRTAIPVVGDSYTINFGGHEFTPAPIAKNGVVPSDFAAHHGPLSLAPQTCALLHIWLPSQSAASSFELEVGYQER